MTLLASPMGRAGAEEDIRAEGLDNPPPPPPEVGSNPSLLQGRPDGVRTQAMMYLAMIQKGSEGLGSLLPGLGPALGEIVSNLMQTVPQALMAMSSGPLLNPAQSQANVPSTPPVEVQ